VSDSDSDASVNQATVVQWFQIGILINYVFSDELKKNEPQKDENIKGKCVVCGIEKSGRRAATSNWQRHFKVDIVKTYKTKLVTH
jgi:hypothetical protein